MSDRGLRHDSFGLDRTVILARVLGVSPGSPNGRLIRALHALRGNSLETDARSLDVGTTLAHFPTLPQDVQLERERLHLPEKDLKRRLATAIGR